MLCCIDWGGFDYLYTEISLSYSSSVICSIEPWRGLRWLRENLPSSTFLKWIISVVSCIKYPPFLTIAKQHKDDMIFGFLNKNFAWFSCPADKVDSIVKFIGVPIDDWWLKPNNTWRYPVECSTGYSLINTFIQLHLHKDIGLLERISSKLLRFFVLRFR